MTTATKTPSITETLSNLEIGESLIVQGEAFTKIGEGGFENAEGVFFSRTEIFCKMMNASHGPLNGRSWFVR
jgi:hypothetical protein